MIPIQLLDVGSKLIGLYFLVFSAPLLLSVTVGLVFSNMWDGIDDAPVRIYIAVSILGLIVVMSCGWALFRRSGFLLRIVFKESGELTGDAVKETFTIGVRLIGVFVGMAEFLNFTKLLSNHSMLSSLAGPYGSAETMGMATNFIPSMVSVLAGLLLFFRGELLANWAFAEHRPIADSDSSD